MRALVAAGRIGDHDGVDAAVLIGRAWRSAGAHVAALGLAEPGADWARAHRALCPDDPAHYLSLTGHGPDAIVAAMASVGVCNLPRHWSPTVDMSAMDFDVALERQRQRRAHGVELVGICAADQTGQLLTGPLGLAGTRGDLGLAERLGLDRGLEHWAQGLRAAVGSGPTGQAPAGPGPGATGDDASGLPGRVPGSGAGGGAGAVVQAFGGTVRSGVDVLARAARLEQSIARADLVVTSCDVFDVDHWGSPVTDYVAALANKHEKPVVVIARTNHTYEIGQRSVGIEAVHAIGDDADVTSACGGFARSWIW